MLAFRLGPAEVRFTGRAEGDFSVHAVGTREPRQRAVVDRPWKTAEQVHGSRAVIVDAGTHVVGEADALVTNDRTIAVAVKTADCAPVALAAGDVVAVVHAGWRGLAAGVIDASAAAMRTLGADHIEAALGPCVRSECYEFGEDELAEMEQRFGPSVRGVTTAGTPALDVPAAVSEALTRAGIALVHDAGRCTACDRDDEWWSYRARGEAARQATVVWLP